MSHFLDRLTFFKRAGEPLSDGHGITHGAHLHRLVFVEDLSQGWHRHLGNAQATRSGYH